MAVDDRAQIGGHLGERIGRLVQLVEADPITAVFEPVEEAVEALLLVGRLVDVEIGGSKLDAQVGERRVGNREASDTPAIPPDRS